MSTGCRIYRDFTRPPAELIQAFLNIPVSNIADCMNRMAAVQAGIIPIGKKKLLGPSFTVKVPEGDNLMLHKALDLAKPGDVIVVDAGGSIQHSIFGELMANYCKLRGIAGIIVDGCIRDADEIAAMDFPVYARGITPNGPSKNGPGEINTPISFAGRPVFPGDIVVGDGDGIVFIAPNEASEILAVAKLTVEKEKNIMDSQLKDGLFPRPWMDENLRKIGCEEFDFWVGER